MGAHGSVQADPRLAELLDAADRLRLGEGFSARVSRRGVLGDRR